MKKIQQQIKVLIIGIILFAGAILPVTSFAQDYEDSPFGFNYAFPNYTSDLGIKWIRANAVWGEIQSETDINNGVFNWDAFERHVKFDSYPEDVNFLITITHLATPVMESDSYIPNCGAYTEESWIKYAKALVSKYKGSVKYWQVGNEPKPYMKDFAKLQEITYNAIKEECSECQVLMGGVFWAKGDIEQWDKLNQQILLELNGKYVDVFDQHYFGSGNPAEYNPSFLLDHAKQRLTEASFNEILIWITEISDYSGDPKEKMGIDPPYQSEQVHAQGLFKRYLSSLSYGVKKVFWYGFYEGCHYDETYHDFNGIIYDGKYDHDMGYGVKKLAYYTYKLMTEKLEGSDWDNIQTIQESDNIYIYKFTKQGKPIWVAWWDYFEDTGSSKTITLDVGDINSVKITEAVPNVESGNDLNENDYPDFFKTETKLVNDGEITISFGERPVFIEELSTTSIEETGGITPNKFRLNQNYPNPFNPTTNISYQLPVNGDVALKIYNMLGQEVCTLINENKSAGNHSVVWNGTDHSGQQLSPGVYFYSLELDNNYSLTKRMLFLK